MEKYGDRLSGKEKLPESWLRSPNTSVPFIWSCPYGYLSHQCLLRDKQFHLPFPHLQLCITLLFASLILLLVQFFIVLPCLRSNQHWPNLLGRGVTIPSVFLLSFLSIFFINVSFVGKMSQSDVLILVFWPNRNLMRFFLCYFSSFKPLPFLSIVKTLLDYVVTGIDLVAGDDVLTKQDGIDANTCANFCNRETDCTSINFCNNPGTTSCELTMSSPYEPSAVTVRNDRCTNYVQKASLVPGWGVKNGDPTAPQQSSNRMGGGAFFGVICAMIILGLVLGVASVLGYNWYRNKGTGLGLGVSVKYVRQNNDNLISNEEQPVTSFSTAVPLD